MKKSLIALCSLGLLVSLQAGSITCDYPVVESEPVYKTVTKKIPVKDCWEEVIQTGCKVEKDPCSCCTTTVPVYKTVTKCKTTWETEEEQILVGYKNYADVCGKRISKFSKCKLSFIRVKGTY
jgi:hypothetical protein